MGMDRKPKYGAETLRAAGIARDERLIYASLKELARYIADEVRAGFDKSRGGKELTGNLRKSITPPRKSQGNHDTRKSGYDYVVEFDIRAPKYKLKKYLNKGIFEPIAGSYAALLDEQGSPWGNHQGYVMSAITQGLSRWGDGNLDMEVSKPRRRPRKEEEEEGE